MHNEVATNKTNISWCTEDIEDNMALSKPSHNLNLTELQLQLDLEVTDPEARTTIGASGNFLSSFSALRTAVQNPRI